MDDMNHIRLPNKISLFDASAKSFIMVTYNLDNLKHSGHLLANKGDWLKDRSERKLEIGEIRMISMMMIVDCWLLTTTTEKSSLFFSSSALDSSFNSSKASRVSSLSLEVINRFHEKESKTWPGCTARHTLQPISLLLSFKGFHENQFSPSKYLEDISIKKITKTSPSLDFMQISISTSIMIKINLLPWLLPLGDPGGPPRPLTER